MRPLRAWTLALALLGALSIDARSQGVSGPYRREVIEEGVRVELAIDPVDGAQQGKEFHEGENVRVRFRISDTVSGTGISGASPAAWMDLRRGAPLAGRECTERVANHLGGGLSSRADMDLTIYYVLTLNDDGTIHVVDPIFGYGNTRLLAQVELPAPGVDWALAEEGEKLFVSMPAAGAVAIINTATWKVTDTVRVAGVPAHVLLQPDGRYLWVEYQRAGGGGAVSGVAVIDAVTGRLMRELETGHGAHTMAVDPDGRFAFITNTLDGTVTVIDARDPRVLAQVPVGGHPLSISYSPVAAAAYVADSRGAVSVVDGRSHRVIARAPADTGITSIRFAPGGRFAFIVSPEKNRVLVLDAATNRVIQSAKVDSIPDAVYFSDRLAYVRHVASESVLMIPLDGVGREGAPLSVVSFPGGDFPPGRFNTPTFADGVVQAPGEGAVLVANPLDRAVYYYSEGMAAPMGSFSNYRKEARAVQVLDRSLHEKAPGEYQTVVQLGAPGTYDISFLLDAPRIIHCFELEVKPEQQAMIKRVGTAAGPLAVKFLDAPPAVKSGSGTTVRFTLSDPATMAPISGLRDVQMRGMLAAGLWWEDVAATETATRGTYEASITLPDPGAYYFYVGCPSRGMGFNNAQFKVVRALPDQEVMEDHASR